MSESMTVEQKMARSVETWRKCDPILMASQSQAALIFAFRDMKRDILVLADEAERLQARVAELESQLPEGMKRCTIQFRECEKGHGWLTASNWVQHECATCERDELRRRVVANEGRDAHSDDLAVDLFAHAMKQKLAQKREQGRGGWETCPPEILSKMLIDHIAKGDPVDVANFCMMLHQTGNRIVEQPRPAQQSDGTVINYGTMVSAEFLECFNHAFSFLANGHSIGQCFDMMKFARAELIKSMKNKPAPRQIPPINQELDEFISGLVAKELAKRGSRKIETAPRPVPTAIPMSERLPFHTDADYGGLILAFTRFTKEWVLQAWTHVHNCPNAYTHWQPTGLVRPAEPDGGAA